MAINDLKKTNNSELFVVNKQELITKIHDIIQNELKNNSIILDDDKKNNSIILNDDKKNNSIAVDENGNKKKIRRTKKELFKNERASFISKINKIIKLEENNYAILYDDLVENMELKNFLIDNMDLIKTIYSSGKWAYVTFHLHGTLKKNEVNLMKSIYKNDGYRFASKIKILSRNGGIKKKHTEIHFILPNNIN